MDLTANVVLGSSLHVQSRQLPRRTHTAAPTGCAAIDTHALDGGFRYGEVATIAGANGTGKTLVLARHTQCPAIVRIVGLIQAGSSRTTLSTATYVYTRQVRRSSSTRTGRSRQHAFETFSQRAFAPSPRMLHQRRIWMLEPSAS